MTPARLKLSLILAGAAFSALVMLAWTQDWFVVTLDDGASLPIAGEVAAGGLSALALAGFALVVAISIAGPVFRVILGVLEALLGVAVVASAAVALGNPVGASSPRISEATSIAGEGPIAELVADVSVSVWPAVAIVAGVLLVAVGIAMVLTARRWPGSSRKYQAVRLEPATEKRTSVDDWDSLTGGDDPTGDEPAPAEPPR